MIHELEIYEIRHQDVAVSGDPQNPSRRPRSGRHQATHRRGRCCCFHLVAAVPESWFLIVRRAIAVEDNSSPKSSRRGGPPAAALNEAPPSSSRATAKFWLLKRGPTRLLVGMGLPLPASIPAQLFFSTTRAAAASRRSPCESRRRGRPSRSTASTRSMRDAERSVSMR